MQVMLKYLVAATMLMLTAVVQAAPLNPLVTLETSKGDIVLELNPAKAPISTENFVEYVQSGFFEDLIFHRVMSGFMIQGGGFDARMIKKDTRGPIRNESTNGLANDRGTIAMARTQFADSATAQFYINLQNNDFLNGSAAKPGYAVFGKVIKGMEVVDEIAKVRTSQYGPHKNVPVEPIVIKKAVLKIPGVKTDKKVDKNAEKKADKKADTKTSPEKK